MSPSAENRSREPKVSPVAQRLASEHGINLAAVKGTGTDGRVTREDVQAVIDAAQSNGHHAGKVLTAPAVRKLARDNGIDLTTVRATGSQGRIRREDVEALLNAPTPAAVAPAVSPDTDTGRREIPITPMRQAIARRLTQTVQEAPHFFTTAELDFTQAIAALPKGIGVNTLILYLTIRALQAQPELNATYENGHLYQYDHVHLAIAVALPNGLIAPVLHRADDYSLAGLSRPFA